MLGVRERGRGQCRVLACVTGGVELPVLRWGRLWQESSFTLGWGRGSVDPPAKTYRKRYVNCVFF